MSFETHGLGPNCCEPVVPITRFGFPDDIGSCLAVRHAVGGSKHDIQQEAEIAKWWLTTSNQARGFFQP